jgi:hypothetical protein
MPHDSRKYRFIIDLAFTGRRGDDATADVSGGFTGRPRA